MMSRIGLLAVTAFWITMNILLWRAEVGGAGRGGNPVSTQVVLERLLTSPDPATLEVRQQGKSVGYLHWYPDPGEEPNTVFASDFVPEGMVRVPRGLQVRLEGNITLGALGTSGTRLHVDLEVQLSTNRQWQAFSLHLGNRSDQLRIRASEVDQELDWRYTREGLQFGNRVDLRDARDPVKLLGDLAGPLSPWLTGPWSAMLETPESAGALVEYDAWLDWLPLGTSRVRIYRLRIQLAGRYEATVLVNRAGEVLRVDLPGGWRLLNEGLASF
jgi:hypothetical protein